MPGPATLHNVLQRAIDDRAFLIKPGTLEQSESDQLLQFAHELMGRAAVDMDGPRPRVALIIFCHMLVARAEAMAEFGLVPREAPRWVAQVAGEMATVLATDLTIEHADRAFALIEQEVSVG